MSRWGYVVVGIGFRRDWIANSKQIPTFQTVGMSVYKDVNKPNRDEGRLLYTSLQKDVSFDHQQTRKVDLQNDMSYSVSQNDLLLQLSQLVECLAFSPNPCLQGCHWRWVFVVGLPKLWFRSDTAVCCPVANWEQSTAGAAMVVRLHFCPINEVESCIDITEHHGVTFYLHMKCLE